MKRTTVLFLAVFCMLQSAFADVVLDEPFDNLNNWSLFGSPSPLWLPSVHGRTGIFDNNGDASYDNGATSLQTYDLSQGFTLEADIYLDFYNLAGCWAAPAVGIANGTGAWAYMEIAGAGEACWATPPDLRGHAYIYGSYQTDGGAEGFGGVDGIHQINADAWANAWHTLRIVVGSNLVPTFYIDDTLIYAGSAPLAASVVGTPRSVWLGTRSSGSAGKAYHDHVQLTLGESGPGPDYDITIEPFYFSHVNHYVAADQLGVRVWMHNNEPDILHDVNLEFLLDGDSPVWQSASQFSSFAPGTHFVDAVFGPVGYSASSIPVSFRISSIDGVPQQEIQRSTTVATHAAIRNGSEMYEVNEDAYRFDNPDGDYEGLLNALDDECFINFPTILIWWLWATKGACAGMAASSQVYFEHPNLIPNGAAHTWDLEQEDPDVMRQIYRYQTRYGGGFRPDGGSSDPLQAWSRVIGILTQGRPAVLDLTEPGQLGHAILAYRSVYDFEANQGWLSCYENNHNYDSPTDAQDYATFVLNEPQSEFTYGDYQVRGSFVAEPIVNLCGWLQELRQIVSDDLWEQAWDWLGLACPARMLITDSEGRRTGYVDGMTFVNEIPGASMELLASGEPDDSVTACHIPRGLPYSITIFGLDADTMDFEWARANDSENLLTKIFRDVRITSQSRSYFEVNDNSDYLLRTDLDGDGTVDTVSHPLGECPDWACEIPAGMYRTETHGAWGQDRCRGQNFACIRDSYFAQVFPNGLTVGGGYTLHFTTSSAIGTFLPNGGPVSPLDASYIDPASGIAGGVFASQVAALALNVGFGQAGFGGFSDISSLAVSQGILVQESVSDVLSLANAVLGGDLSALPPSVSINDLNETVALINSNFEGGTFSRGYLVEACCFASAAPGAGRPAPSRTTAPFVSLEIGTNPFNPTTTISFDLATGTDIKLVVYNLLGRTVATLADGWHNAGSYRVTFDGSAMSSGVYFARFQAGSYVNTQKILLAR